MKTSLSSNDKTLLALKSLKNLCNSFWLSLGSQKVITNFKETNKNKLKKYYSKQSNKVIKNIPYVDKDPTILLAYNVEDIKISDVIEPEPLP